MNPKWAEIGARIARESAEGIIGTLADEYEALLRHCRPVDIESARHRHGE